jgi:hypothetical protein
MKSTVRAALCTLVVVALTSINANAAPGPTPSAPTARTGTSIIPPGVRVTTGPMRAFSPNGSIITCTPKADYPHDSNHVNGTMNVVGHVSCTATVAIISASISLEITSNDGIIAAKTSRTSNSSSWNDNAATVCTPGYYHGYVEFSVTYPPNYSPHIGYGSAGGASAYVPCAS